MPDLFPCFIIALEKKKGNSRSLHFSFYLFFFLNIFFCLASIAQSDSLKIADQNISDTLHPLKFSIKQLYVPMALGGLGTALTSSTHLKMEQRSIYQKKFKHFNTSFDDYLALSPVALVYGLDAIGIKAKTDIINRSIIVFKGGAIQYASTILLKHTIKEERPDGSNFLSFPSSHTSIAFASATFLAEEYKHKFKWMPYAAYTLASGVGVLRMVNNKHYLGDIIAGAGIGILSMKVAYWTHQYKWNKKRK